MPKEIITPKVKSDLQPKVISIFNRKRGVGKINLIPVIIEELANAGLTEIKLSQKDDSKFFDLLIGQKALDEVVVEQR